MATEGAGPRRAVRGAGAALALWAAVAAGPARALMVDGEFLHVSASPGASADLGVVVGPGQYIGSVFELGERSRIAQLGGNLLATLFGGARSAQVVAGVVAVGAGGLPDFAPAELADNLLATAILTLESPSSTDVLAPVIGEVFLEAGVYGLVFASALEIGGATISGAGAASQTGGAVGDVSPTTPASDRPAFFSSLTPSANPWSRTSLPGTRFLVSGREAPIEPPPPPPPPPPPAADAAVPLPPAGLLLLSAILAGAAARRRGR